MRLDPGWMSSARISFAPINAFALAIRACRSALPIGTAFAARLGRPAVSTASTDAGNVVASPVSAAVPRKWRRCIVIPSYIDQQVGDLFAPRCLVGSGQRIEIARHRPGIVDPRAQAAAAVDHVNP